MYCFAPLYVQDFCTNLRDVPHDSGYFLTCRDMHREGAAEVARNLRLNELKLELVQRLAKIPARHSLSMAMRRTKGLGQNVNTTIASGRVRFGYAM
jgi:hypothetical protein